MLSEHSLDVLVCNLPLPPGARDWSEREPQVGSTRGTNKPPALFSAQVAAASHRACRALGSFDFLLGAPCRRQLLAYELQIRSDSAGWLQLGRGAKSRNKQK
jgi:hypothetical protein